MTTSHIVCSVLWKDIFSIVGDVQCCGGKGYHGKCRRYLEYRDGFQCRGGSMRGYLVYRGNVYYHGGLSSVPWRCRPPPPPPPPFFTFSIMIYARGVQYPQISHDIPLHDRTFTMALKISPTVLNSPTVLSITTLINTYYTG